MGANVGGGVGASTEAEVIQRRRLTNAIFRASDKMYLHTTSVERSAVFGICIAGRITEDQRQRTFLLRMLAHQQQERDVEEVDQLMRRVWFRRDRERARRLARRHARG